MVCFYTFDIYIEYIYERINGQNSNVKKSVDKIINWKLSRSKVCIYLNECL